MSSCVGIGTSNFTPVHYYDLGRPDTVKNSLNIDDISLEGAFKTRMLKRLKPESIQLDEYNRWSQSPDALLTHYLKLAFVPAGAVELNGEILSFENDLQQGKAFFTFHYQLTRNDELIYKGVFHSKKKCTSSASSFARAMAATAAELRRDISSHLNDKN